MHLIKYILVAFLFILVSGCEKSTLFSFDEFYSANDARFINLTANKDFYLEDDEPFLFKGFVSNELRRGLPNVEVSFIVNRDTIEGNAFAPTESGEYVVQAVTKSGLRSPSIRVNALMKRDIESFELDLSGINYLTTAPWSVFKTTKPIANGNLDLSFSSQFKFFLDGQEVQDLGYVQFSEPGSHKYYYQLDNLVSEEVLLEVREEKEMEIIELPVVFHFYQQNSLASVSKVNELLAEANVLFNNTGITAEEILSSNENPNKVNTYIRFYPATEKPDGTSMNSPGINIIQSGNSNSTSLNQLDTIANENFWDPNHYINIWVARGEWTEFQPWNSPGYGSFLPLLKVEAPGVTTLQEEPESPYRYVLYLNGSLGFNKHVLTHELGHLFTLHHTFDYGCRDHGDFFPDTYSYSREGTVDDSKKFIENGCDRGFFKSNIMDYGGPCTSFTYDQRERIRLIMDHGLFVPSPRNRTKIKQGIIQNPPQAAAEVYY